MTPGCGRAASSRRSSGSPRRRPPSGSTIPQRPELIVDIDDAKAILADQDGAALVSVRTWNEHIGAVSGYNYIGPAGRIVGDVWGNCGSDAYHMQHYRTVDNTMRAYPEIAANWAEAGITPDKRRLVLLRYRLARQRDLVLCAAHGLAGHLRLRRWLVRVEPGLRSPIPSRSASPAAAWRRRGRLLRRRRRRGGGRGGGGRRGCVAAARLDQMPIGVARDAHLVPQPPTDVLK